MEMPFFQQRYCWFCLFPFCEGLGDIRTSLISFLRNRSDSFLLQDIIGYYTIYGFPQVELLSRLHHFHVVPLIGYCSEFRGKQAERLLVFEYMLNGNLRDCLDGVSGENMMWSTRVAIAIGAARGLEYLHEAAAPRILHRDVKSTNILLDENWRAKVRIFTGQISLYSISNIKLHKELGGTRILC